MSSPAPPPSAATENRRWPVVRLSPNPDVRSVQIGVAGTVLLHVLLFLLAPMLLRFEPVVATSSGAKAEYSIELTPDSLDKTAPEPPPNKFVETNPDAPENEPDKTTNFAARSQQVAQEKPTPDGRSDRPALEGKKDFESNQIVTGSLTKPIDTVPEPPALETPPSERIVAAPQLAQNPLSGFEKNEGENLPAFGTNIAKPSESAQSVPDKTAGVKDVPLIQGATSTTPQIDPQRPRPRPSIVRQPQVRPAIFAENKFGTSNIGPMGIDARWSNYGAYLQRMMETVQLQWEQALAESKIYPVSGSTVEVKFIMNVEGAIMRVVDVQSTATDAASRACMSAITERSPYGKWTEDMIAVLGTEQQMTFKFYYQ